jgi:aminopeptidase
VTPTSLHLRLDKLARIAIGVGVNLQPGQPLAITAPLAAHGFVHRLAKAAYRAGGGLVTCSYEDPDLMRLALTDMDLSAAESGCFSARKGSLRGSQPAGLCLVGPEPSLLDGIPVERILGLHNIIRAREESVHGRDANTCVMPFVTRDWATVVRPGLADEEAVEALWKDILLLCDADADGTERRLISTLDRTARICGWLNDLNLKTLHVLDEGTDLHLHLLTNASWSFSRRTTASGICYLAELPPGPVRTSLDPAATHGSLKITQSIKIAGVTVHNLTIRFEAGRVSRCDASSGRREFEQLISADAGAARLSMIGLAERPRPRETFDLQSGFLAPALDRASKPHVTFGSAAEGIGLSAKLSGANQSAISIDVFFEKNRIEVNGALHDGSWVPLYRNRRFLYADRLCSFGHPATVPRN